mgnify:FL=1
MAILQKPPKNVLTIPTKIIPIIGLVDGMEWGLDNTKIGIATIDAIRNDPVLNDIGLLLGIFWSKTPPDAKQMLIKIQRIEANSSSKFSMLKFWGSDKIIKPIIPIKNPNHFLNVIISFKNILASIKTNKGIEDKKIASSLVLINVKE